MMESLVAAAEAAVHKPREKNYYFNTELGQITIRRVVSIENGKFLDVYWSAGLRHRWYEFMKTQENHVAEHIQRLIDCSVSVLDSTAIDENNYCTQLVVYN